MNERCSAVLLNKLPLKEKVPGSFTIPCDIGNLYIDNALADLGASISLMPYLMYEKLCLSEPKPTRMSLELADRIDDLDQTIHLEAQGLLEDDQTDSFLLKDLEKHINQTDLERCEENTDSDKPIRRIEQKDTMYSLSTEIQASGKTRNEHL
ncbi:hypothetical protein Tco_1153763 [Tanacetum coccineum]